MQSQLLDLDLDLDLPGSEDLPCSDDTPVDNENQIVLRLPTGLGSQVVFGGYLGHG